MAGFPFLLVLMALCGVDAQSEDALKRMFLRLYSSNIEKYVDARLHEARNLVTRMEPSKPTVIYLHGYSGSVRSRDVIAVISGYLERGDHNAIALDWSPVAGKSYPSVVSSAKSVGKALAGAIDELVEQGLSPDAIHVVGHSMGAQVAGHAGRRTSFELKRITGLDPAGPFFNFLEAHLTASDASFVDTIHTDAGFYGISRASGAASFYPNGGKRVQPGCPANYELSSPEDYCSHHRSWLFYAESLTKENSFVGTNCSSYRVYARGSCDDNAKVPMGFATPAHARGAFFLTTKSSAPFGMQMDGALSTNSRAAREEC